ncbi:MAG TPA: hypothetical protein VKF41_04225 [Bryobacteraceae bacterium]|nr:hypothetical protein [Bryobacteraceae bacterium]
MYRMFGLFGLAIMFLLISAPFRARVMGLLVAFVEMLAKYSPISYVIFAMVAIGSFLIFVSRGSRPR